MLGYRLAHLKLDLARHACLPFDTIARLISDALHPRHFFLAPPLELNRQSRIEETIRWEIFRGRLLHPSHTRKEETFLSWNVYLAENGQQSGEPLLSVKYDKATQLIHIVRGLHCYVWEGYSEGSVYRSRETTKWIREWLGAIDLRLFAEEESLLDELAGRLFQAAVGLSRLPLTSVESPLPGFTLGKFGYFYLADKEPACGQPMRSWRDLLTHGLAAKLSQQERTKLIELVLRACDEPEIPAVAQLLAKCWRTDDEAIDLASLQWARNIINEVSLSPYTHFVDNLLLLIDRLVAQRHTGVIQQIDFYSYVLRQLGRHLTAYDLSTFHHFGANYPDALLLDAVLKEYLRLIEQHAAAFLDGQEYPDYTRSEKRLRRRALRQAWIFRRHYDGLLVPDAPTSTGENARVLPPPHVRVPEEQITNLMKRKKKLYQRDPLEPYFGEQAWIVFRHSIEDLELPQEMTELGAAIFIDRPLGIQKTPGEPDQTLLFAHKAISKSIARQRLQFLQDNVPESESYDWERFRKTLESASILGVRANRYRSTAPRVVSLADASRLVDDFVLQETLYGSWIQFFRQYQWAERCPVRNLEFLTPSRAPLLILPDTNFESAAHPRFIIYDHQIRKRAEFSIDFSQGYITCGGREYPAAGLQLLQFWGVGDKTDEWIECDLTSENVRLGPALEG